MVCLIKTLKNCIYVLRVFTMLQYLLYIGIY